MGRPPRPSISSLDQPKMRSAAGFHSRMRVSRPNSTSASGEESISACSRSSSCLPSEMSLDGGSMATSLRLVGAAQATCPIVRVPMDPREKRMAENEAFFREVNERIGRPRRTSSIRRFRSSFCASRIMPTARSGSHSTRAEYEAVRADPSAVRRPGRSLHAGDRNAWRRSTRPTGLFARPAEGELVEELDPRSSQPHAEIAHHGAKLPRRRNRSTALNIRGL